MWASTSLPPQRESLLAGELTGCQQNICKGTLPVTVLLTKLLCDKEVSFSAVFLKTLLQLTKPVWLVLLT